MEKRKITAGIVAHVDAGKTTLSEAMLYLSGKINKLGRVDKRDSALDTHSIERARGITVFSKQAHIPLEHSELFLIDTPGHADFSAETERSMSVLDCAVLVISGIDGVQAHTETVWRLLRRYGIPTFIFVSKMDLPVSDKAAVMADLKKHLSDNCTDFSETRENICEAAAMCSESAMEEYLSDGEISDGTLSSMIAARELFPCFFGSGLRLEGVEEFLTALDTYAPSAKDEGVFSARAYKILRDSKGARMTGLKITDGTLTVRSELAYTGADGSEHKDKISAIRIYTGEKFEQVDSVSAGSVCMALGLEASYPGMGLGAAAKIEKPLIEPVMSYTVSFPNGEDPAQVLPKLQQLAEEDPQLHLEFDRISGRIFIQLMGRVQTEIIKSIAASRFGLELELDVGHLIYKETIESKTEGVGHFEPLRHYAEVHLILEPLPAGSGLVFTSECPEDELDRNWQRLILTHLYEKPHLGVLTGSRITDMKISLASGRAHPKHTEGGDFRQATYRAVRQGLMSAKSVLLEPYYAFTAELPTEQTGRLMTDVRNMGGSFSSPESAGDVTKIEGLAPVSEMSEYQQELVAYTRGRGRLFLRPGGYRRCRNSEAVIAAAGYNAERDTANTADSVFCAHGAGFNVPWNEVPKYMHLESVLKSDTPKPQQLKAHRPVSIDEKELEAIMEREFGPIKRPLISTPVRNEAPVQYIGTDSKKKYIIVDGYNLIFASEELKKLASDNLDLARQRLMDMLSDYCGFTGAELVLVFDAYRTPSNPGSRSEYNNILVAFTGNGETADAFIERFADGIGKNYSVRVVTSDNLIRLSALRSGVLRTSSKEFLTELADTHELITKKLADTNFGAHKQKLINGKQ